MRYEVIKNRKRTGLFFPSREEAWEHIDRTALPEGELEASFTVREVKSRT